MSTTAENSDKCVPVKDITLSSASNRGDDGSLIDKSIFDQSIRLVAINIPAKLCTVYLNEFKDFLLKRPRMKRIYDAEKDGVRDSERRLLVLTEDMGDDLQLPKLPESLKAFNVENNGIPEIFMLKVSYENIPVEEVLRKILPAEIVEIPSSFEQVGHIAHLNLREEVLQYKNLIGE
jgi:tRNA (guanine37-N1)-methyltransferase